MFVQVSSDPAESSAKIGSSDTVPKSFFSTIIHLKSGHRVLFSKFTPIKSSRLNKNQEMAISFLLAEQRVLPNSWCSSQDDGSIPSADKWLR